MNFAIPSTVRRHSRRVATLVILAALYSFTRLPELPRSERVKLAETFRFTRLALPEGPLESSRQVRDVHPSLGHIASWISSVGAAVALNDLDGDGLSNDVCYVDVRTDEVIVAPVPGTGARYPLFTLHPNPLPFDSARTAPMGCVPADMNEDGLLDVLVYYWGRTPVAFLRRSDVSDATAALNRHSYFPREVARGGERWFTNAAAFADLNGDGHLDLIIGNYFQDGARILDPTADRAEEMQRSMSRAFNAGKNRFLLWTEGSYGLSPDVRFVEATSVLEGELARGWTLAVGAADLDGDLLPEVYFANDFGPDRLLHNRSSAERLEFHPLAGRKTLTTPNSKIVGCDSFKGMGVDFGDVNGDGIFDIYISNIAAEYALEESHFLFLSTGDPEQMKTGVAPYVDASEQLGLSRSGWAWEARLADFNNDGVLEAIQATGFVKGLVDRWPELHEAAMGNDELLKHPRAWFRLRPGDAISGEQRNPFFVRAADGRYYDLSREIGLDEKHVSRGIATADVDGDGDLDFAVANQWERSFFYRNDTSAAGAYLGLHLRFPVGTEPAQTKTHPGHPAGAESGRYAVGAIARVYTPDGRRFIAQVDGGNGHSGKRSFTLHFGLGSVSRETQMRVELSWRDPRGRPHQQTLHLTPGWHTVLLGSSREKGGTDGR